MNNKNKIYTISSIFSAVSLILVLFFIWPLISNISKNSNDLITAKNNIVTLDAQMNEVDKFQQNYKSYKPNFASIDKLFVDPSNPVDFIEFLENTALSHKITSQISLPPASGNPQLSQNFIVLQFSSKGSFSDVLNFVGKIEAGPYLLEIENINIQNSQDKNAPKDYSLRKVDAVFNLKVFTKK